MPSLQLYRRRIRSIANTRQITKAMELVAASKMRRAQDQATRSREYASVTDQFIGLLSAVTKPSDHPLLVRKKVEKALMVVITSDRGLAGVYNSQLLRTVLEFEAANQQFTLAYLTIGKRGQNFLSRTGKTIVATFTKFPDHPTTLDTRDIAKIATDGFLRNEYDAIHIAYTNFVSMVKQTAEVAQLLPIVLPSAPPPASEYTFEPVKDEILEFILPRALETILYQRILESIASEHSSRMIAMKNASDNAKELIDDLTLTYNSARQAKITQELSEITSAVQAVA